MLSETNEKQLRAMMLMSGALVILSLMLILRVNRSLLASGGHGLNGPGIGLIVPIALVSLALFITSISKQEARSGEGVDSTLVRTRIIVVIVAFLVGFALFPAFDIQFLSRAPRLMGFLLMLFPLIVIGGVLSSFFRR